MYCGSAVAATPWHPLSVLVNYIVTDVFYWKIKAENHLKQSGINYAIVRPSILTGDQKTTKTTNYKISQGDSLYSTITRPTVAAALVDAL